MHKSGNGHDFCQHSNVTWNCGIFAEQHLNITDLKIPDQLTEVIGN